MYVANCDDLMAVRIRMYITIKVSLRYRGHISGIEAGNGFYSELVPKLFIHHEYNAVIIENILRRQKGVL